MPQYSVRIDEVSPTVTYVGSADVGSSESVAVWQIKKLETVGNVLSLTYPNGVNTFNSVWTARASYTYS